MFDEQKNSLGHLTWDEVLLAVTYLERPKEIRQIMLGEYKGWYQIFTEAGLKQKPPSWLSEWSSHWTLFPLFTILEGDPIEGISFIISDSSCGEFWFGMGGSPADEFMEWRLRRIPVDSNANLPPTIVSMALDQVFTYGLFARDIDPSGCWSPIPITMGELETMRILNRELLPRHLVEQFIKANRTFFPPDHAIDQAITRWLEGQYIREA